MYLVVDLQMMQDLQYKLRMVLYLVLVLQLHVLSWIAMLRDSSDAVDSVSVLDISGLQLKRRYRLCQFCDDSWSPAVVV